MPKGPSIKPIHKRLESQIFFPLITYMIENRFETYEFPIFLYYDLFKEHYSRMHLWRIFYKYFKHEKGVRWHHHLAYKDKIKNSGEAFPGKFRRCAVISINFENERIVKYLYKMGYNVTQF